MILILKGVLLVFVVLIAVLAINTVRKTGAARKLEGKHPEFTEDE